MATTGSYVCGNCAVQFETWEAMRTHVCSLTGKAFNSTEHLDATSGGQFGRQSVEAVKRGEETKREN